MFSMKSKRWQISWKTSKRHTSRKIARPLSRTKLLRQQNYWKKFKKTNYNLIKLRPHIIILKESVLTSYQNIQKKLKIICRKQSNFHIPKRKHGMHSGMSTLRKMIFNNQKNALKKAQDKKVKIRWHFEVYQWFIDKYKIQKKVKK